MSQQGVIHERIRSMFPFLIADGWTYRGFIVRKDEIADMVHLRFEKKLLDRKAWARLSIAARLFDVAEFDMKARILKLLHETEGEMIARHHAEFAGAA